jgi:hypothetical protein
MSRCRYCYQTGHNQRTCPKKTAALKKRHDREIEAGATDSYWIKQYKERLAPRKKSQQTCGYCQERGHSRRKCDVLQKDIQWYVKHHNSHAQLAHDYIMRSPIGIGSLFRETQREYDYNISDYVIKSKLRVLTDFQITKGAMHEGRVHIKFVLRDPTGRQQDDGLSAALHDYVKDPTYQGSIWHKIALVTPNHASLGADWLSDNSLTQTSAKQLPFFKRVGRKNEDHREWAFNRIETFQSQVENTLHAAEFRARAADGLDRFCVDANRARMFADFKNGQ